MSYLLDTTRLRSAVRSSRYGTLTALADATGVHRNTLQYYLSGKPVISDKLARVLDAVGLDLKEVLVRPGSETLLSEEVADAVDALGSRHPDITLVLFGSRARRAAQRYSDFDIGAYSHQGMPHDRYRAMRSYLRDLEDRLPVYIDLVNLNRADRSFLRHIRKDWHFLCGRQRDWLALNREAGDET